MLNRIANAVGEVVHGVHAPSIAGALVGSVSNAINHRITHIQIWRGHINFQARHMGPVRKFSSPHASKQVYILIYRTLTVRAVFAGLRQRATGGANFLRVQRTDVGLAIAHQCFSVVVDLLKIVRRMGNGLPLKTQPRHIVLNGFHIFVAFFDGVGVIKAQVGCTAIFFSDTKIQTDAFGVTDMQESIGLGRKAGNHTLI